MTPFQAFLSAQRLSKSCVECYSSVAERFERAGNITRDGAAAFLAAISHTNTAAQAYYALKAYSRWKQEDLLDGLKAPSLVPNKKREPIPAADVETLLYSEHSKRKNYQDVCAKAIFCAMTSSGMRLSEVLSLQIEDLAPLLLIRGKGNKEREVYLSPGALVRVRDYIESTGNRTTGPIFITTKGKPHTRGTAYALLTHWTRRTLGKPINPHRSRHTFATQMLEKGTDLKTVSEFLGHASIITTQIYLTPSREHKLRQFLACSPIP